jgi:hypothetical protein
MSGCAEYGDLIVHDDQVIFVGTVRLRHFARYVFSRRWLVRWWWGSDVLLLHSFMPGIGRIQTLLHRIKSRMLNPLMENWAISEGLQNELRQCGYICETVKFPFIEHDKINRDVFVVGYYRPKEDVTSRWKYGIDIIEEARGLLGKCHDIVFLEMNSRTIPAVLGVMDVYVRPSRHDGEPRLVVACNRNGIPVYYDPKFRPDVYEMVNFIMEHYMKRSPTHDEQ